MIDFSKAYSRADFVNYLRRDFLPDDFEQEEKNIPFWSQMNYASVATCLGKSKMLDLVVYEIKHSSRHDARVGLSKDAFRMLAGEKQSRALVIFVPENDVSNYRFSLIEIQLSIGEMIVTLLELIPTLVAILITLARGSLAIRLINI